MSETPLYDEADRTLRDVAEWAEHGFQDIEKLPLEQKIRAYARLARDEDLQRNCLKIRLRAIRRQQRLRGNRR